MQRTLNVGKWSALLLGLFFTTLQASAADQVLSCVDQPVFQTSASAELQKIELEDQADRKGQMDQIDWKKVTPRDLQRRIRVAELFAAGCFKDAKDFANAALVYQHGDTADHAFQAFVWAKRAIQLGDSSQKSLMAVALDRYLVRSGQKELFASQASKGPGESCWCLEPVEESFPEKLRVEYAKRSLSDELAWVKSLNEKQPECAQAQYCKHDLKPSPAGTVPGFW